jgi:DNA-binding MarR family transcriptional regulator
MDCNNRFTGPDPDKMHRQWVQHLHEMSGGMDTRGLEIAQSIRMIARFLDLAVNQSLAFGELSGPRLGILLRLMGEEDHGNYAGINPTLLSRYQDVKKNTITSLLKGLEDRGLIERSTDPEDRRGFLIRITPAGRELVRSTAPARFEFMNQITSSLTDEERDQLLILLGKLRMTLVQRGHNPLDIEPQQ